LSEVNLCLFATVRVKNVTRLVVDIGNEHWEARRRRPYCKRDGRLYFDLPKLDRWTDKFDHSTLPWARL